MSPKGVKSISHSKSGKSDVFFFSDSDRRMREHFTIYHPDSTAEEISKALGGKRNSNVSSFNYLLWRAQGFVICQ